MTQLQEAVGTGLSATARVSPGVAGRLAFELWRRPGRPVRVRASERAVHEAARTACLDHPRGRVTTYAWGDGERPVLLVHGWGSRASRWSGLVTALLDAGLSPVSYDAWAHGSTPGRVGGTVLDHHDVIAELDRLSGGFEALVGHSFGVPVTQYAAREGLAAGRLVAIGGMGDFGYLVDTFCSTLRVPKQVNAHLRRAIERAYFDGDTGIWERFSVRDSGRDLLVVHDAGDRVVERAQADVLVEAYGGRARLVETTGLGHSRIVGDPGVVGTVVGFLT